MDPNGYFLYSSHQELNLMNIERLAIPIIEEQGIDRNGDGINDEVKQTKNMHIFR